MHLDDAVALCRRYTGETHAGAQARIRDLPPSSPLIPSADYEQAFLESELLRALMEHPTTYTTRPSALTGSSLILHGRSSASPQTRMPTA
jgi:hypothetical protein